MPSRYRRGGFLFVFEAQQVSYGHAKVFGNLVGCGGVEVLFAAVFEIGENSSADANIGTQLAASDAALGAEERDAVV